MYYTLLAIAILLMLAPVFVSKMKGFNQKKAIRSVIINGLSVFAVAAFSVLSPLAASAQEVATTAAKYGDFASGMGFIAAAIVMGIASIGAGIAVGSAGSAAAGATSENPKVFGKVIIFVVLGEGIAIMAFVVSFLILSKI